MSAGELKGLPPGRGRQPDSRRSSSLETGIALLEYFTTERQAIRIAELADMAKLSRSTTHRYISTLALLGYLEQDEKRRYRLADAAANHGLNAIRTLRAETPQAAAVLEDLREQTGHTVSMATLDQTQAIYTHRLFAHGPGQYQADLNHLVGAHIPLHSTAIGKALLASLSQPEQRAILQELTLKRAGPNTITRKRALTEDLAGIRTSGIATCDQEQASGVRSIAAPITRPGRSRPLAIAVTIPAQHHTTTTMTAKFADHVKAAAERI
jgi:IclR family pca regulon transcriptional regulator